MKGRRVETFLALLCMLSLPAWPRSQDKAGPVVNKQRVFFSELETQWLKAAQEKDPAALNRIVTGLDEASLQYHSGKYCYEVSPRCRTFPVSTDFRMTAGGKCRILIALLGSGTVRVARRAEHDISTWSPTKTFADYIALNTLPRLDLDVTAQNKKDGQEGSTTVTVHNPTS